MSITAPSRQRSVQTWSPLRHALFRTLWLTWLGANLCMWMNEVSTAWLMTTLTSDPVMIALVQSAATLPVFLLGLPSGALADILDRRRLLMLTHAWLALVAVALSSLTFAGLHSPWLLLGLTFANGIGLALRWPVSAALLPEVVPRDELSPALALNALSMNLSRVLGPMIAGTLIAAAGPGWVFVLNAVVPVLAFVAMLRWRHRPPAAELPPERLGDALRIGLQHIRHSPRLRPVLLRVFAFFFNAVALMALLPLVARGFADADAATYTLLVSAMGGGAIAMGLVLPNLRARVGADRMVRAGPLLHAGATLTVALAGHPWQAGIGMALAGMGLIATANSLTVAAQLGLPDWVRARGMAVYQMALMGGGALGAATWGKVADLSNVPTALSLAATSTLMSLWLLRRVELGGTRAGAERADCADAPDQAAIEAAGDAFDPAPLDVTTVPPGVPILVSVEYRVSEADRPDFLALMQDCRRARLASGARDWQLLRDADDVQIHVEQFVDSDWLAHRRRRSRMTASDLDRRTRKYRLHSGDRPPRVRRFIQQSP